MPLSKQRNKHIQRVLIEAAKLAPRESPELAMIRARELERGNPNRATLAVARKMVCYMLAVERRRQDLKSRTRVRLPVDLTRTAMLGVGRKFRLLGRVTG